MKALGQMRFAEIRAEPFICSFSTRARFAPDQYGAGGAASGLTHCGGGGRSVRLFLKICSEVFFFFRRVGVGAR